MRKILIILGCFSLFFLSSLGLVFAADVTVSMGPEEVVFINRRKLSGYPTNDYFPDSNFSTYSWQGKTFGVLPGLPVSYITPDGMKSKITDVVRITGLKGQQGGWDREGDWLVSVINNGQFLDGFYHGERFTTLYSGPGWAKDVAGIGYAKSTDGGKTWIKDPRQILAGRYQDHAADPDVKKFGDYLYAFYDESGDTVTDVHRALARAPASSHGVYGSWKKYYCNPNTNQCDFTEPGVRGKSTPIEGLFGDAFVTKNEYLGKYLAIDGISGPPRNSSEPKAIILRMSDDLINWKRLISPADAPKLPPAGKDQHLHYFSLLSLDGKSDTTGKEFWLYYVRRGDNVFLLRRKITLNKTGRPPPPLSYLPGDANRDDRVNSVDYDIWKLNYGTSGDWSKGNFNSDTKVDGLDYVIWFDHYEE